MAKDTFGVLLAELASVCAGSDKSAAAFLSELLARIGPMNEVPCALPLPTTQVHTLGNVVVSLIRAVRCGAEQRTAGSIDATCRVGESVMLNAVVTAPVLVRGLCRRTASGAACRRMWRTCGSGTAIG